VWIAAFLLRLLQKNKVFLYEPTTDHRLPITFYYSLITVHLLLFTFKSYTMKSLWNCTLVFGKLLIPVKLFSATKQSHPEFEMVDSRDMSKICMNRFNSVTGEFVPSEFIGKAHRLDGNLVPVDPSLISSCLPAKSNQVEFTHFCPFTSIPAVFFDSFYYLLPAAATATATAAAAAKDYAIVLNYLQSLDICGVAQSYFRNLSALFVLSAHAGCLVLHKIRFQSNFVDFQAPSLPAITGADVDAQNYILGFFKDHVLPFDPSLYSDSFT
jgi:DNA end-binding protein Ku